MIANAIRSTLDYCLFTLGFVLAVQLPEFIQQYKQFLAGKLTEAQWHIDGYKKIADQTFGGDITVLINEYLNSPQSAIQKTGQLIEELSNRYQALSADIQALESPNYIERLIYFIQNINLADAQTVISYYQLAVPLTTESIASGVVLGFLFVWIRMLITSALNALFARSAY